MNADTTNTTDTTNTQTTNQAFVLDAAYATTRRVSKEKPVLANNPGDKIERKLFAAENHPCHGGLRMRGYFKHGTQDKPLMSVVTVVLNNKEGLEKTITSIIEQSYDNIEHIIIDGGSTDGTLDVLKKYENMIDYWVSEADNGIYDAMNKGLCLTSGDYLWFLNADDTALPNVEILHELDGIHTNIVYLSPIIAIHFDIDGNPSRMNIEYGKKNNPHPGVFYPIKAFLELGLYDLRFSVAADQHHFHKVRSAKNNFVFHRNAYPVAYFPLNGYSFATRCDLMSIRDFMRLAVEYKSAYYIIESAYFIISILRKSLKRILRRH